MDQQMNLNFNDIADAIKIIDHAAQEGAFKGWDNIRPILSVRDKLQAFVESAQAAIQKNKESAPSDEDIENIGAVS
jgi:hypothetical protein